MAANYKNFTDGFLVLNPTGGTTSGKVLLRLQDISLSYTNDNQEVQAFDIANFAKEVVSTTQSWEVSCSGALISDTSESIFQGSSSGSSYIVNAYNGLDLLELAKDRTANPYIVLKLDSTNYQKGNVRVAQFELSGSAGGVMTYSISLTGNGALTKSTS